MYGYGGMLLDRMRMDAHIGALQSAVEPGSVVADIGAGPGLFALLACKYGARRVFAVEPDNSIELTREAAIANGYDDRLECLQAASTELQFPERADVVIADLRGVLPFFRNHIPSVIDMRERLLAPDGILIQQRDTLWAALVDSEDLWSPHSAPWETDRYQLSMEAIRRRALNTWRRVVLRPEHLCTEPARWSEIDYRTVDAPNGRGLLQWHVDRDCRAHGICLWFEAELYGGHSFSTAPGDKGTVYGQAFFPLSEVQHLQAGDRVAVSLRCDLIRDDYVWSWTTRVDRPNGSGTDLRQSTFYSIYAAPELLESRSGKFRPGLNPDGALAAFVLGRFDGRHSTEEIAADVVKRFPDRFKSAGEAISAVADLSERFAEVRLPSFMREG